MSDSRYHTFQKGETPAQFFLQVEEGMARFDVPDAANLATLLEYSRSHGYQIEPACKHEHGPRAQWAILCSAIDETQ